MSTVYVLCTLINKMSYVLVSITLIIIIINVIMRKTRAPLRAKIALFLRTVMHIINLFYLL